MKSKQSVSFLEFAKENITWLLKETFDPRILVLEVTLHKINMFKPTHMTGIMEMSDAMQGREWGGISECGGRGKCSIY